LVVAGGSLGTLARYGLDLLLPAPGGLPLATFVINVSGAFLLGWLLERLAAAGPDTGRLRAARLTAGTGFLGGFTTYSALTVEAVLLFDAGRTAPALLYLAGTLLLGAAAAACGAAAAGAAARRRPDAERLPAGPRPGGVP
jgi:CrcB protein